MAKSNNLLLVAIISFFIISVTFSSSITAEKIVDKKNLEKQELADWTVMYYMCSDLNFFSKDPKETAENLSRIGSTDGLNILVMKDNYGFDNTELYLINDTGGKELLNEKYAWPKEVDTGDTNTLIQFCRLMMRDYPARYYSLVLVAPGTAGWVVRSLHDSNGVRGPSWPKFGDALKQITNNGENKIDVAVIESCVLGLIENAYEISPYVEYIVTSEEHIPDGIECVQRYYEPLWDLKNNTKLTPEEYANSGPKHHSPVNFTFFTYTALPITKLLNRLPNKKLHTVLMHTTCCAANLSNIDIVVEEFDNLVSLLILNSQNQSIYQAVKKARSQVREYGKGLCRYWRFSFNLYRKLPLELFAFNSWIDVYNLVELIKENIDNPAIENQCDVFMQKYNSLIFAMKRKPEDNASHGLSIYFPYHKFFYNSFMYGPRSEIPCKYSEMRFCKDTLWDEYLRDYLEI